MARPSGRTSLRDVGIGVLVASLTIALPARAQDRVAVAGVVRDTAGAPIGAADVAVVALHRLTRTDDSGRFVLHDVAVGRRDFAVRRLGFEPQTVSVDVSATPGESLVVVLKVHAALLEQVNVSERDMRRRSAIEDFYRRRARGLGGMFVTREDLEARNTTQLSNVLRALPGIQIARSPLGSRTVLRFVANSNYRRDCEPQYWLDGRRVPTLQIDDISTREIEGVELYAGPASTPIQFAQDAASNCGTVVIWTRVPGT